MLPLLLLACDDAEPPASELPPVLCSCDRPPGGASVHEEFLVLDEPADLLLAADPARMDEVAEAFPSIAERLGDERLDVRVGLVSTALGDAATAGELLPLGPDGWWSSPYDLVIGGTPIPEEPPLGGLGATVLGLRTVRPGVAVRVLIVQEADDATPAGVISETEFVGWFDDLGDVGMVVLAPEPAPRLDGASAPFLEARFGPEDDLVSAIDAALDSLPGLSPTFELAGRPDPATLVVEVEDVSGALLPPFDEGTDWIYDPAANAVTFLAYLPNWGSVVRVSYTPLDRPPAG